MNIQAASVKGPGKQINDDSYGYKESSNYALLVVSDGLGSSKNSHVGSKMAVKAVKKAIFEWRKLKNQKLNTLLKLTHIFWKLYISDLELETKDCLTTCLFSYVDFVKRFVIIGQLGDGLILFKSGDNSYISQSSEIYNYTQALGSTNNLKNWVIEKLDYNANDLTLFLATDGISEDIISGKEFDFSDYLIKEMCLMKKVQRNYFLRSKLKNWPTKYHSDDKTMCIAWSRIEK